VTDSNGDVWRGDATLNAGGDVVQPSKYITAAYDFSSAPETAQYTAVLNMERYGALSYSIPITGNGVYEVQLLVAETWHQGVTTRVFNVDVQGTRALSNVNMVVDSGFQHPYLLRVPVTVTNGASVITVQLSSAGSPEPPALYGILLRQAVTFERRAVDRINAGGPNVTDGNGNVWRTDAAFSAGGDAVRPSKYITVAYDFSSAPETAQYTAVLNMERYGSLSYSIPISGKGTYEVQLLVAETWHQGVTARVFNVDVQGTRALSNVNMIVDNGFQHPYLLRVPVTVTDVSSAITVQLTRAAGSPEPPAVYGIVLFKDVAVPVVPNRRRRDAAETHYAEADRSVASPEGYAEQASWASGVAFAVAIVATTAAVVVVTRRRASIVRGTVHTATKDDTDMDATGLHLSTSVGGVDRDYLRELA
jgi:hypothetical protein